MYVKFILYVCGMKDKKNNIENVLRSKNWYYLLNSRLKAARRKSAGWMSIEPLRRKLELLGWKPYQKVLTPKQFSCIIDYVGELDSDEYRNKIYYYV